MLTPFNPPPGIIHDGTGYSSKGTWYDCDKIRFRGGFPEKIGGWTRLTVEGSTGQYVGVCRAVFQWVDLSGILHVAVGTSKKLYIENSTGTLSDKTPLRAMPLPSNPVATSNTFTTVTITHTAHGLTTGDRVLTAGISAVGGLTTGQLNGVFTVTVTTANAYTYDVSGAAATSTTTGGGTAATVLYSRDFNVPLGTTPFATTSGSGTVTVTHTNHGGEVGDYVTLSSAAGDTVNGLVVISTSPPYTSQYTIATASTNSYTIEVGGSASGTGSGGGTCYAQYEISIGNDSYATGAGFGSGGFGGGTFGSGGGSGAVGDQPRTWSIDNFGEDLILNPRGGAIYYYDTSVALRPIDIRLRVGASSAPSQANYIMVSDEDRRVFAFGVTDPDSDTFDPMLLRWSDPESDSNWAAGRSTTAGQLRLSTGSGIRCALKTRGEILAWTESTLVAVKFADEFVYGQTPISPNIDIIGVNSAIAVDDMVLWMGQENFFIYDGRVGALPCDVRQKVFSDINLAQSFKVVAGSNRQFREVWWFYPSADSTENDRYVVFNYAEKRWYYGSMNRTGWSDSKDRNNPVGASTDGYLYLHESGLDDGETGLAMEAYIETSPIEMDSGERLLFLSRVVPDVTFAESEASAPGVTYTLRPRKWPGGVYGTSETGAATQSVSVSVEQWTDKIDLRLRARQFVMRVSSSSAGVMWRLGVQRFGIRPDGRK